MMLLIGRHTKNYRKPLHLHGAFFFVVVIFFFVAAVDSATATATATTTTTAADAAAAAATTLLASAADKLIVDDSLVVDHEENSNYAVLRGTLGKGKTLSNNSSNHTVHLASHQHQKQQQSQKGEKEKENLTPTKFLGLDYKGNPVYIPLIGAGTWQYDVNTTYESVCKAFGAGYNFVDTAYGYKNQKGVGMAIKDCWKGNRTNLFVMTKIPGGLNSSQTQDLHERNLEELGLDYVDHLMIHYPSDWYGKTAGAKQRQDEWLALEAIYKTGEARTIGISHYCSRHILDVLWVATITPAINQVEYHIGSQDVDEVIETCSDFGITFMSFSPLCGPCTYEPNDSLVNGDLVTEIAEQYKHNATRSSRTSNADIENIINDFDDTVTGNQVALAYIVQQGIPVIPKSNTMAHIISNAQIFDFVLSDEHMERLKRTTKPSASPGDCDVVVDANDVDAIEEEKL